VVAHCSFGITYNMAMAWLPSYYNSAFGVNLKQSAMLSVLPFSVMAVTTNASGWIADALMNRKVFSTSKTRKLLHLVGTGTPALCLGYLATSSGKGTVSEALLLLTVMLGGLGLQAGGFASTHQDICTKYAGVLFGLTNACSSLAGSLSIYATGLVLDWTHSWGRVFGGVMACNLVSLVVFLALGTSEPLFD
jgi:ACS family sodium-dependent inorganic phosphate cotransporter